MGPIIQPCSRSANSHCPPLTIVTRWLALNVASRRKGPILPSFLPAILEPPLESSTLATLHQELLPILPESSQRLSTAHKTLDRKMTHATRLPTTRRRVLTSQRFDKQVPNANLTAAQEAPRRKGPTWLSFLQAIEKESDPGAAAREQYSGSFERPRKFNRREIDHR